MNIESKLPIPVIGEQIEGGFFTGVIRDGDDLYGLVTSNKAEGTIRGIWNDNNDVIPGAQSYSDGYANTVAMAAAGSKLAQHAISLTINGMSDWYIPSRDEKELQYRAFKPSVQENCCSFRDGDNPSSVPVGYPYTPDSPAQTTVEAFREGGAEAFDPEYHWSSTQSSADSGYAWMQDFFNGGQNLFHHDDSYAGRVVRRFKL